MRHQDERRDSKSFLEFDEECGIPTSVVEDYRAFSETGPLAPTDPRALVLSMSEYNKSQNYEVYDYHQATRPQPGQHYAGFAAHTQYPSDYVATQAQVPSGLPQSAATYNPIPPSQQYGTHDPTYYAHQNVQYPAYVDPTPRHFPEITHYAPKQGHQGDKVTVYLNSPYDLENPPVTLLMMFGQKRVNTMLTKTTHPGSPIYQYAVSANAPPLTPTSTPSPQVPLTLAFEDSTVNWQSSSFEFGSFTYLDQPTTFFSADSPQLTQKKRKLSPEASPRRSPSKKPSLQHLSAAASAPAQSPFRRPSVQDAYSHGRRVSGPEASQYQSNLPSVQPSQQYYATQNTPSLQTVQSPSWNRMQATARSPSSATLSSGAQASILPSPSNPHNPPLIRTSALQHSPVTPNSAPAQLFNPYAIYPSNAKAMLKLDGELNTMTQNWTHAEKEVQRRLVQFRRSQSGSVITGTFEPVTLEERLPNSICVSCIWWEEKKECYVTSVDTISLLESLVAVRFTVEEKNRIRRNLEGFRPATVSKTKADSEEFFKLIMGFPNPKPRNIEKDVKVFPWRILSTALRKIIGKYSASYSSTASTIPNSAGAGPSYATTQVPDARMEQTHQHQRHVASPHSTVSSVASHAHVYAPAMAANAGTYSTNAMGPAGLGIGPSAGPPDLRLSVPVTTAANQATSWHQPSAHYSNDLSATGRWLPADPSSYMNSSPATGMPGSAQSYQYYQRMPPMNAHPMSADGRLMPMHGYDGQGQPTTTS